MAESGQQWRDGQADSGHDLPECGRLRLDQLCLCRRGQYDQGGFGGAGHQNAGFGRRAGTSPGKAKQAAGNGSLDQHNSDHSDQ